MDRRALHDISYGVYIISTKDGDRSTGCIANSVMQVTSDPATVAVSINHLNYTNECIKSSGYFAVSVLPEDTDPAIIGEFGFKSGRDEDKFAHVERWDCGGLTVPAAAKSHIVCRLISSLETATHTVFLGEVMDAAVLGGGEPMTYSYYHKVIKGKSPKNAPTYDAGEKSAAADTWQCSICGYIYDGETPFEELPSDFVCPVCGVSKSLFKKK